MDIFKLKYLILLASIAILLYSIYTAIVSIGDISQKLEIEKQMDTQINDQRYEYLKVMLQEHEIISDHKRFVEEQVRERLGYAKPGEVVIYFPEESADSQLDEVIKQPELTEAQVLDMWLDVLFLRN